MVERAGYAQAPVTPPATGPERPNQLEARPGGPQSVPPTSGTTVSPGSWGAPPGLTPPSEASQPAKLSSKQKAASDAEVAAQRAYLEYQVAKDALAAMDPNGPAAIAAKKNVAHLQDLAVEAAIFSQKCQTIAGNKNLFDGAFFSNRFDDVTGSYPSGVERAEILVQRARGTPIGLAYTARENLLAVGARLEYAKNWLARAESQTGNEQEKVAARGEVARCEQARLTAAQENADAWERAKVREEDLIWDAEKGRGGHLIKPDPASYDIPEIRECKAGLADAEKTLATIRGEIVGNAPAQDSALPVDAPSGNELAEASMHATASAVAPAAPRSTNNVQTPDDLRHAAENAQNAAIDAGTVFVDAQWDYNNVSRNPNTTPDELLAAWKKASDNADRYLAAARKSVDLWIEARDAADAAAIKARAERDSSRNILQGKMLDVVTRAT